MRKLTLTELSQDVLTQLNLTEVLKWGGQKDLEKIIKKLNKQYQHNPKVFSKTNEGEYNLLQEIVDSHINTLKFFK